MPQPQASQYYGHLENDYVQYAAERGVPAMLALLWMIGGAVFDFARALRRLPWDADRTLGIARRHCRNRGRAGERLLLLESQQQRSAGDVSGRDGLRLCRAVASGGSQGGTAASFPGQPLYCFVEVLDTLQAHPSPCYRKGMDAVAGGEQPGHQFGHGEELVLRNEIERGAGQTINTGADGIFRFRFFRHALNGSIGDGKDAVRRAVSVFRIGTDKSATTRAAGCKKSRKSRSVIRSPFIRSNNSPAGSWPLMHWQDRRCRAVGARARRKR